MGMVAGVVRPRLLLQGTKVAVEPILMLQEFNLELVALLSGKRLHTASSGVSMGRAWQP